MTLNRRAFLGTTAAFAASSLDYAQQSPQSLWGGPVIDIHLHLRRDADGNFAHIEGCGVRQAVLLAMADRNALVEEVLAKYPGRFVWSASTDITKPGAEQILTKAVKSGAIGIGEIKAHVAADGPELQRMYAFAADLNVPILVHFQEVPHYDGEGTLATGFAHMEAMLKAYPKTRFVGHADAFWANIDASYANQVAYPTGPIKQRGITDKLLSDYPNLFGDLSANSGNNALSRDAEFTAGFLERHQNKLIFGSDCGCTDGKGGGIGQPGNPAAARLAGKCVARETLTLLRSAASGPIFRKLTWENAHQLYGLPA